MSFAIGIDHTKNGLNIGTLWRSAYNFGASMIFTIGKRYKKESSDTQNTYRHIPLIHFEDNADFIKHFPYDWQPIIVELDKQSTPLKDFKHPKCAVYILGAEDHGVSKELLDRPYKKVFIETQKPQSVNVAVAASIIMYDRLVKTV